MPGFGSVGIWEAILILAVLLLVFGARRLPEIGSALGKGIREFKSSVKEIEGEINRPADRGTREFPRSEAPRTEAPRSEVPRSEVRTEPDPAPREGQPVSPAEAERRPE